MDRFLGENRKSSVHEVGLLDLMSISLLTGYLPKQRALIGIQPALLTWGETLSPAVAEAMPKVCDIAAEIIARFVRRADLDIPENITS
jgi:hydrogenase maturation protease